MKNWLKHNWGWVAIVAGVMLLVLSPLIRKWQHGVT